MKKSNKAEKTTKTKLEELKRIKEEADKKYFEYRALYNKQHNVKPRNVINEIITLHEEGLSNKEIVAKGYNKNTVNRQVSLYSKRTKKEKTVVSKMF